MSKEEFKKNIKASLIADMFFIILPFFVMASVLLFKREIGQIFYSTGWSLASTIVTGQTIVKLISGVISAASVKEYWKGGHPYKERFALLIIMLIVLLISSILIYIFVMLSDPISIFLIILQILVFVIAIYMYFILGYLSEEMIKVPEIYKNQKV